MKKALLLFATTAFGVITLLAFLVFSVAWSEGKTSSTVLIIFGILAVMPLIVTIIAYKNIPRISKNSKSGSKPCKVAIAMHRC